jgi:thymidylate kinase
MLINIVGCDGCGKTTQILAIKRWLKEEYNLDSRIMTKFDMLDHEKFPECGFMAATRDEVAAFYTPMMKGQSRAIWLMYMLAVCICHYPPGEDEIVLADGYWHKHFATESGLGADENWLMDFCAFFPKPTINVLLDISPEKAIERKKKCQPYESGCDFSCSRESFVEFQSKVRNVLLRLAESEGWAVVHAERDSDSVFQDVRQSVLPHIQDFLNGTGPCSGNE